MSQERSVTYVSGLDKRKLGSPGRTRTYDPAVNSRLLYQLSYRGSTKCRCYSRHMSWETSLKTCFPIDFRNCSNTELQTSPLTMWRPEAESNRR